MVLIKVISLLIVILGFPCSQSWIMTDVDVRQLVDRLDSDLENKLSAEDVAQQRLNLIYPGTKWCGAGSAAEDYDDLGSERATDICCRAHDLCPDAISSGATRYNLTNDALYTRLSCECDEQFRQCLRQVNTGTSNSIGTFYFNGLATKCFRRDYPATGCVRRGGWLNRKCLKYTYDTSAMKVYQWFYVNNY